MNSAIRVQIPDEAIRVSLRANALGKGMNPSVPLIVMGIMSLFSLGVATRFGE